MIDTEVHMELKEFEKKLQENEDLHNRYGEEIIRLTSEGMGRAEAMGKAAAALGYELDREEILASVKDEEHEMSEDELEAVSGGYVWAGDDAPDGHELTCLVWYYHGWLDFYQCNQYTYCKDGKGQVHVFNEAPYMYDYYAFGDDVEVRKCSLCGAIVPVNPRWADRNG